MHPCLACLLLVLALPASAQIYKYTDAKGNVVFSQQPPEGIKSELVELPKTNTAPPPPATQTPAKQLDSTASVQSYRVLELTDLPADGTLRANNGRFSVSVRIEPALRSGHHLRLLLDGNAYGQPSRTLRLQLSEIERGEHRLAVEVLAGEEQIQKSSERTITVLRTSIHNPSRGH
jgi:hypothetical protein